MDMMTEREVIRNETCCCSSALTRQSEDLRKLVAFEGAFERCFNIAREEARRTGSSCRIASSCATTCSERVGNQTFFRELRSSRRSPT